MTQKNELQVGDRVVHKRDGSVGIVEAIDNDVRWPNADVRWLTPHNEPSVLSSICSQESLIIVGANVVPMPRSKEWWDKAREFIGRIEGALSSPDKDGGG